MTEARNSIVQEDATGTYWCDVSCVRGAFLCGRDRNNNRNYDYRIEWFCERFDELARLFAIDLLAYSIMPDRFNVMFTLRRDRAMVWSPKDVAKRWMTLTPKRKTKDGRPATPNAAEINEITKDRKEVTKYRERLASLSWYMKVLNEPIARRANREDGCRGRFWNGRFRSQHVLDEAAVLACMTHVDLIPVFTKTCKSLHKEPYSSAVFRQNAFNSRKSPRSTKTGSAKAKSHKNVNWITSLNGQDRPVTGLTEQTYLELLDWTLRAHKNKTTPPIPPSVDTVLRHLRINTELWHEVIPQYRNLFRFVSGNAHNMQRAAKQRGNSQIHGITTARKFFACAEQE